MKPVHCPHCQWILSAEDLQLCPDCGTRFEGLDDSTVNTPEDVSLEDRENADDRTPLEIRFQRQANGGDIYAPADDSGPLAFPAESWENANPNSTFGFDSATQDRANLGESHGIIFLFFSPFGRIGRLGFLLGNLLLGCFMAVIFLIDDSNSALGSEEVLPFTRAGCVAIVICGWLIAAKRFHDFGWSGWNLLWIGMFCGGLWIPVMGFGRGSIGRNTYGIATRLRWDVTSIVLTLGLGIAGVYATAVLSVLARIEADFSEAWVRYEKEDFVTALPRLQALSDDAQYGRGLCPFCKPFAGLEMYASWASGDILGHRQEWDSSVEWLKRSEQLAVTLQGASCCPEIGTELPDIRLALVNALEMSGHADEAIAILDQLTSEKGENSASQAMLLRADRTRGINCLNNQEFKKAEEILNSLIDREMSLLVITPSDQYPRSCLAGDYHNRALARQGDGNIAGALEDVQEAIQLQEVSYRSSPGTQQYSEYLGNHYSLKASLHYDAGELQESVEAYEKASAADPQNIDSRTQAAWLRYTRGEYQQAVSLLDSFLEDNNDAGLEYLLAVCLLCQDLPEQAAKVADRRRLRNSDDLRGLFLTGVVAMKKGDYAPAIVGFEAAEAFESGNVAVLYDLACCQLLSGHTADVERILPVLEEASPDLAAFLRRFLDSEAADPKALPMILELQSYPVEAKQSELPASVQIVPHRKSEPTIVGSTTNHVRGLEIDNDPFPHRSDNSIRQLLFPQLPDQFFLSLHRTAGD